jgi:hypothetical protein
VIVSGSDFAWGIVLIAAGVFISVWGTLLFRFALAMMGFGVGFLLAMRIFEGQDEAARVLIAFAAGGVGAIALYALIGLSLYAAGAILGLVVGVAVTAIIDIFADRPDGIVALILTVGGAGLGAFFGRRLGDMIILLATSGAGAMMIVSGIAVLFESRIESETTDPTSNLAQRLTFALFIIFFAVSALAQFNYRRLQRRIRPLA